MEDNKVADEQLKDAVEAQFKRIQRQSTLLGAQAALQVVLHKIMAVETQPKKVSMNDYRRLIKDIKNFAETGLSRKIDIDGEPEETVQN